MHSVLRGCCCWIEWVSRKSNWKTRYPAWKRSRLRIRSTWSFEDQFINICWEISPLEVLVTTLCKCMFKPASIFAKELNLCIHEFCRDLPVHICLLSVVLLIAVLFLVFVFVFGNRIWTPLLRVEPTGKWEADRVWQIQSWQFKRLREIASWVWYLRSKVTLQDMAYWIKCSG